MHFVWYVRGVFCFVFLHCRQFETLPCSQKVKVYDVYNWLSIWWLCIVYKLSANFLYTIYAIDGERSMSLSSDVSKGCDVRVIAVSMQCVSRWFYDRVYDHRLIAGCWRWWCSTFSASIGEWYNSVSQPVIALPRDAVTTAHSPVNHHPSYTQWYFTSSTALTLIMRPP